MHCIIGMIHQKDVNVEEFCYRFLYENEDYWEIEEEISFSELREMIEDHANQMESSHDLNKEECKWIRDYVHTLRKGTDKEKIDAYADWFGYTIDADGNRLIRQGNPYGECDWFVIGGRWSGELKDYDGQGHDSLRVQDMNLNDPDNINGLYGIIRYYENEDWVDYDGGGSDTFKEEIGKAIHWSEVHEEPLYITLIDMHQ